MNYDPPKAPYVQARYQGGKQKPTAIILRPSFTNSNDGAALAVAQAWHRAGSFWDAGHYTVDGTKRFRCVDDRVIAGATDSDKGAIRIALCAEPTTRDNFWDKDTHRLVLRKAADLVAELSLAYKINVRYLDDDDLARWEKRRSRRRGGIYIPEDRGWPHQEFLEEVAAKKALKMIL